MKTSRYFVMTLTVIVTVGLIVTSSRLPPLVVKSPQAVAGDPDIKRNSLQTLKIDESKNISARTLNRFHLALVARVIYAVPKELDLKATYSGIVTRRGERAGILMHGSIGMPLRWDVFDNDGIGIFTLQISSRQMEATLCSCRIDDETVFVQVIGNDGPTKDEKYLSRPYPKLGGRSIAEVVKLLENEPGELERN